MLIVEIVLLLAALCLFVPILMLFLECSAALWGAPALDVDSARIPRTAVVIPAHNEASGIAAMLYALLPELPPHAYAVVVADNCSDATAEIARGVGVTVLERRDTGRLGKSYALAHAIEQLATDPPEVVIFVDADCWTTTGTLERLARAAYGTSRPVQAVYLLDAPSDPRPTQLVSAFAFRVKNLVRPSGLARLGLPCMLTGSGMAFPWAFLRAVPLASGKLAEDVWLTIELAGKNQYVSLVTDARVLSKMPSRADGARAQHTRWEHGHLESILQGVPELVRAAWEQKQLAPLWLMLDLCVPPLSLLFSAWAIVLFASLGASVLGLAQLPFAWSLIEGLLLVSAIVAAWSKYGRGELPLAAMVSVPLYILAKLTIYGAFLIRRQRGWKRSERD